MSCGFVACGLSSREAGHQHFLGAACRVRARTQRRHLARTCFPAAYPHDLEGAAGLSNCRKATCVLCACSFCSTCGKKRFVAKHSELINSILRWFVRNGVPWRLSDVHCFSLEVFCARDRSRGRQHRFIQGTRQLQWARFHKELLGLLANLGVVCCSSVLVVTLLNVETQV